VIQETRIHKQIIVQDWALIRIGARIRAGTHIGQNSIAGDGVVVSKNVPLRTEAVIKPVHMQRQQKAAP